MHSELPAIKAGGPSLILAVAFSTILLGGIFEALFGLVRLGSLIKFAPQPVMAGFQNIAAILLFQLGNVCGFDYSVPFTQFFHHIADIKLRRWRSSSRRARRRRTFHSPWPMEWPLSRRQSRRRCPRANLKTKRLSLQIEGRPGPRLQSPSPMFQISIFTNFEPGRKSDALFNSCPIGWSRCLHVTPFPQ
jgi:Sulfate permease family